MGQLRLQADDRTWNDDADGDNTSIVSLTDPRPHKTGVHLNFPHITCDCRTALGVREVVVQECSRLSFEGIGEWEDIVDASVYKQSGLRMIGSRKVDSEYVYRPVWRLVAEQEPQVLNMELKGTWQLLIKATSIRTFSHAMSPTTLTLPDDTASPVSEASLASGGLGDHVMADIKPHLPPVYRDLVCRGMKRAGDKFFVRTDCKFCLNVEREHGSSKIWFQLQRDGIYQRCFSQKGGDDRYMGSCKTFRSNMFPMPESVSKMLWPDQEGSVGPSKKARTD